jgi:1-phosphofructokinase
MKVGSGTSIAVVAPSPILTVTVEPDGDIHLHAGGQGFWVARLAARLGPEVTLCAAFGGETGTVLRPLIAAEAIKIWEIATDARNGAYIHDRRSGARRVVAQTRGTSLSRHTVDDLYGAAFATGMRAAVTVLTGTDPAGLVPSGFYSRIARDLGSNGRAVIGDLTGAELDAAVSGGLMLLKVSADSLVAEGRTTSAEDSIISWMQMVSGAGARHVIVTRGAAPALALLDGELVAAAPPQTTPNDERGAGDAMMAALAAALSARSSLVDALRHGIAAGAMNVTRSGLGTGRPEAIDLIAEHVQVTQVSAAADTAQHTSMPALPPCEGRSRYRRMATAVAGAKGATDVGEFCHSRRPSPIAHRRHADADAWSGRLAGAERADVRECRPLGA